MIVVGTPAAFVFGGPLSTLLLDMDGIAGFHGWQWLFVIEGAPVLLLAASVLKRPVGTVVALRLRGGQNG
jgi:MFS transporter, ACS family, tartrate transporter